MFSSSTFFLSCLIGLLLKVIAKLPNLSTEVCTPLYSPLFFLQMDKMPVCQVFTELQNQFMQILRETDGHLYMESC